MSRNRSAFRNRIEYVAARSIFIIARVVPDSALRHVASFLGSILTMALRGRRLVVAQNLEYARSSLSTPQNARDLTQSSFSNLCLSFLELDRLPESRRAMKARIRFRDPNAWPNLEAILSTGPVIFSASHFGAYEIGGLVSPLHQVALHTMMRPLDNPWLEQWLSAIRVRFGQRLVANRGGYATLEAALAEGRSAALLVDVNKRGNCEFVDFLGSKAATVKSSALLAQRSGRPLVPVFTYRAARPLHYEVEIDPAIWPIPTAERSLETNRLLQAVTDALAKRVQATPELWLWTHRRWKSRPEDELSAAEQVDE